MCLGVVSICLILLWVHMPSRNCDLMSVINFGRISAINSPNTIFALLFLSFPSSIPAKHVLGCLTSFYLLFTVLLYLQALVWVFS